jgi:hypothetical protein
MAVVGFSPALPVQAEPKRETVLPPNFAKFDGHLVDLDDKDIPENGKALVIVPLTERGDGVIIPPRMEIRVIHRPPWGEYPFSQFVGMSGWGRVAPGDPFYVPGKENNTRVVVILGKVIEQPSI